MNGSLKLSGLVFLFYLLFFFCENKIPSDPQNQPPLAKISRETEETHYFVGDSITFNAYESTDQESKINELKFSWSSSGHGFFTDPTGIVTVFIPDSVGSYVISLTAFDGKSFSEPDTERVFISSGLLPVAIIETIPTDTTYVGVPLILDAGKSYSPFEDSLQFHWQVSGAALITDTSAKQTHFISYSAGVFEVRLTVSSGGVNSETVNKWIHVLPGLPPLIKVKYDSVIEKGQWATLDASSSVAADGGQLEFYWEPQTNGVLKNKNQPITEFKSDETGGHLIYLKVTDERHVSSDTLFVINVRCDTCDAINHPPIAIAGSDKYTFKDEQVRLDGSKSVDVDGDSIDFHWNILNNGGILSSVTDNMTWFTPQEKGSFQIQLKVSDNQFSSYDTVDVVAQNRIPVAKININGDSFKPGEEIFLDGSGSFDSDGDEITYQWTSSGGGHITNPTDSTTTFKTDTFGYFEITLVVDDGEVKSLPDRKRIFIQQHPAPIIHVTVDTLVKINEWLNLDASESRAFEGTEPTFLWEIVNGGELEHVDQPITRFRADRLNNYLVSLTVTDSYGVSSDTLIAIPVHEKLMAPPVADAGDSTFYLFNQPVYLDGSGSSDPLERDLTFHWIGADNNPQKVDIASDENPVLLPPLSPGEYTFILYVSNTIQMSAPSQVKITIEAPDIYVHPDNDESQEGYYKRVKDGVNAARSGDLVFIDAGDYFENNILIPYDDIRILGVVRDGEYRTKIDGEHQGTIFIIDGKKNINLSGLFLLKGSTLSPSNSIDVGSITCKNRTANVTITDCYIKDSAADGIRLDQSTGITVRSCQIEHSRVNGMRCSSSGFRVENCQITNNGYGEPQHAGGIAIETAEGQPNNSTLLIHIQNGNRFINNVTCHIKVDSDPQIVVTDNTFEGGGEGIWVIENTSPKLRVENNTFDNTGETSIWCLYGTGIDVIGNTFIDDTQTKMAMDFNNCLPKKENGEFYQIFNNTITGYDTGVFLYYSPLQIVGNNFVNNNIGISFGGRGITPPNSYENDNQYDETDIPVEYRDEPLGN